MLDELLHGFIATLSLIVLFKTREYLMRLEEVAEENAALRRELKKTRRHLSGKKKGKPKDDTYHSGD